MNQLSEVGVWREATNPGMWTHATMFTGNIRLCPCIESYYRPTIERLYECEYCMKTRVATHLIAFSHLAYERPVKGSTGLLSYFQRAWGSTPNEQWSLANKLYTSPINARRMALISPNNQFDQWFITRKAWTSWFDKGHNLTCTLLAN